MGDNTTREQNQPFFFKFIYHVLTHFSKHILNIKVLNLLVLSQKAQHQLTLILTTYVVNK